MSGAKNKIFLKMCSKLKLYRLFSCCYHGNQCLQKYSPKCKFYKLFDGLTQFMHWMSHLETWLNLFRHAWFLGSFFVTLLKIQNGRHFVKIENWQKHFFGGDIDIILQLWTEFEDDLRKHVYEHLVHFYRILVLKSKFPSPPYP